MPQAFGVFPDRQIARNAEVAAQGPCRIQLRGLNLIPLDMPDITRTAPRGGARSVGSLVGFADEGWCPLKVNRHLGALVVGKKCMRRNWSDHGRTICARTRLLLIFFARVARCYDLKTSQIFDWLKDPKLAALPDDESPACFLPFEVVEPNVRQDRGHH